MPENWKAVGPSILIVTWKKPFMYLCMYKGLYVYKSVYIYIYMFIYKITFSGSEEPFPWPGLVFIIIAVEKMPKDMPSYLLWQGNSFANADVSTFRHAVCLQHLHSAASASRSAIHLAFPLENGHAIVSYFSEATQLKTHKEILTFTFRL